MDRQFWLAATPAERAAKAREALAKVKGKFEDGEGIEDIADAALLLRAECREVDCGVFFEEDLVELFEPFLDFLGEHLEIVYLFFIPLMEKRTKKIKANADSLKGILIELRSAKRDDMR